MGYGGQSREVKTLHEEEYYLGTKTKVAGKVLSFGDDKAGWVSVALLEDYKMSGKWFPKRELTPTELASLNAMAARMQMRAMEIYSGQTAYVPPSKKTGDPMRDAKQSSDESDEIPF